MATPGGTQAATYDAQDRLLTYGKWSYTYTANGDLQTKTDTTTGQVTTYSYDGQGNLRKVELPDGRVVDYLIDSQNRRVGKKINGSVVRKWIYKDQLKPVTEFDGAGTLLARYADGVTVKNGVSYRVVTDHLGTPRLAVDSTTGTVAQRIDTDEWGQVTADSGVGFQAFGFAGGIYDADTGLVRFGARDYDPVAGRWTAKDPIRFGSGEHSLYRYAGGEPVNNVDLTGNSGAAAAGLRSGNPWAMAAAAAILVYEMCKDLIEKGPPPPSPPCQEEFIACMLSPTASKQGGSWGKSRCLDCEEICRTNGSWPMSDRNGNSCVYW